MADDLDPRIIGIDPGSPNGDRGAWVQMTHASDETLTLERASTVIQGGKDDR